MASLEEIETIAELQRAAATQAERRKWMKHRDELIRECDKIGEWTVGEMASAAGVSKSRINAIIRDRSVAPKRQERRA
jgi:hypothetical protein